MAGNDVWAVGLSDDDPSNTVQTLALHWDGAAWAVSTTPSAPPTGVPLFHAVTTLPNGDAWAVGHISDGFYEQTLIEHYVAPCRPAQPSGA